jgi:hypothetical protein
MQHITGSIPALGADLLVDSVLLPSGQPPGSLKGKFAFMGKSEWGRFRVALSSGASGIMSPVERNKTLLYLCGKS